MLYFIHPWPKKVEPFTLTLFNLRLPPPPYWTEPATTPNPKEKSGHLYYLRGSPNNDSLTHAETHTHKRENKRTLKYSSNKHHVLLCVTPFASSLPPVYIILHWWWQEHRLTPTLLSISIMGADKGKQTIKMSSSPGRRWGKLTLRGRASQRKGELRECGRVYAPW